MLNRSFTVAEVWHRVCALDDWRSRPAVALRVRLRASPSAQDDTRGGSGVSGFVRSTLGDPDLRSPSGFDSGLSPFAQDDTEAEMFARSLDLRWDSGVIFLAVS